MTAWRTIPLVLLLAACQAPVEPTRREGTWLPSKANDANQDKPGDPRNWTVDRFVADATGLSRSHVQKLISEGRLTSAGEPLRANAIVTPGAISCHGNIATFLMPSAARLPQDA